MQFSGINKNHPFLFGDGFQRMLFMIFLIIIPNATPGKTNNIGSQTGPNNTPNITMFDEKIKPTVTKNAAKT